MASSDETFEIAEHLPELENKSALTIVSRSAASTPAPPARAPLPYNLKAVGNDHTGIVHEIAHLLAQMNINVEAAQTATSHTPQAGTPIFSMNMKLTVPPGLHADQIRAQLTKLSQQLNVDITIEPASTQP